MEAVLAGCFLDELPEWLIGDKAYDSDALDEQMSEDGIEMISPNRSNHKHKIQDGCPLRRYRRRWKVERLIAWMQNYRAWSRDGNTTSRTSWDSCDWLACS